MFESTARESEVISDPYLSAVRKHSGDQMLFTLGCTIMIMLTIIMFGAGGMIHTENVCAPAAIEETP